jgi:hypothetical protein
LFMQIYENMKERANISFLPFCLTNSI